MSQFDYQMMQRCLELARRAAGQTAPNPLVGCTIVRDSQIVGEGFHPQAGQPHAEIFALQAAGEAARGGTAYINLEPCNHHGRTPPCTEALIAAGIARAIIGMIDPNPLVAGKGIERLRQAGVEVIVGVAEEDCRQLNEAFIHRMLHQRPFGILKYAMTLDGRIAAKTGDSAWVTGTASRHLVHQLRGTCDAVIVGGNTVRQDNPHLTAHGAAPHNPLRVVMSRNLDLPWEAHLWDVNIAATLILTEAGSRPQFQEFLRKKGVEVVELMPLSPTTAMQYFYERQLCSILWECGGILATKAITEGAVQKVMAFIAPKIIGGQSGFFPVGDLGLEKMGDALILEQVKIQQIEADTLIQGYLFNPAFRTL